MEQWIASQRAALNEERQEEKTLITDALAQRTAQECQDLGVSLLHLMITGTHTGLYGRTCISLGSSLSIRRDGSLPAHGFGVGDEVRLTSSKGLKPGQQQPCIEGVISRATPARLDFLVGSSDDVDDELLDAWSSPTASLRLDMLCNEATHRKMMQALDALEKYRDGPAMRLINVLFGNVEPPVPRKAAPLHKTISADLNESQREAVAFALATDDVALIHGPPGTGKTTAVVELILQAASRGQRLLVCAPSNVAVDNIVERIVAARAVQTGPKPKIVRLGHPARLSSQVLQYSLEALIEAADGTEIVRDIRTELRTLEGKKPRDRDARRFWRGELKSLRKEMRNREEQVVRQIIHQRDIVLATNVGAATKVLSEEVFDMVVIDEAAQALEASCWIPLLKGPRLVLAGDHKQLAPTIKSVKAERMGLGLTLFDRLMKRLGESHSRMLNVQYRMHHVICDWASQAMYGGALVAAEAVAQRLVSGLPYVSGAEDMTDCPMLLLDTAGCGMEEQEHEDDASDKGGKKKEEEDEGKKKGKKKGGAGGLLKRSSSNKGEGLVVQAHVRALLEAGLKPEDIAVITPYNGQVELLRGLLLGDFPNLEIRSVDGFQGGEREVVVLSLVRSNSDKTVGFLADDRRLNVAVTRAKRHVAIICDSETVSSHPFLAGLVKYAEEHGEYRSALEYLPEWGGGGAVVSAPANAQGGAAAGRTGGAGERKARGERVAGTGKPAERRREEGGQGRGRRADAAAREAGREREPREPREETVDTNEVIASVLRFVLSPVEVSGNVLELSPELTGMQRKMVHELIDKAGAAHVTHESEGMSRERRLVLRKGAMPQPPLAVSQPAVDKEAAPASTSVQSEGEEEEEEDEEEGEESEGEDEQPAQEGGPKKVLAFGKGASKKKKKKSKHKKQGDSGGGGAGAAGQAPIDDAWLDVGSTGGHVLGQDGQGRKAARANTPLLASLHAERQARLGGSGSTVPSAPGARPPPPRPPSGEAKSGGGGKAKGGGAAAEEIDEMELLEQAINGNMKMTELIRDPSEGMKARYYGWNTNQAQRKDLHKKLSGKIKDSVNDRKPTSKDDKKGGGGGRKK